MTDGKLVVEADRSVLDEAMLRRLSGEGKNDAEIGRMYGLHRTSIRYWRVKLGISAVLHVGHMRPGLDEATLRRLIDEGKNDAEIGRMAGLHKTSIRYRRVKLGISAVLHRGHMRPGLDEATLRRLIDEGKTAAEIGRMVGLATSTIFYQRKKLGIPPAVSRWNNRLNVLDESTLRRLIGEGKNDVEIGRMVGLATTTICYRRKKLGIPPAAPRSKNRLGEAMLRRLSGEGKSDAEIGRMYGLVTSTIFYQRKKLGIPSPSRVALPALRIVSHGPSIPDRESLMDFVQNGMTDAEIGEIHGLAATTVRVERKRFGIVLAMGRRRTAVVYEEAMGL